MLEKVKSYLIAMISAVAGVLGLLYLWQKRKSIAATALLRNAKTNAEIAESLKQVEENKATLEEEAKLRQSLEQSIKDNKVNEENTDNIIDFFRNRK